MELKAGERITRGDALVAGTKKVSVEKALKARRNTPIKLSWLRVSSSVHARKKALDGDGDKANGKSVRVTFGDHKFFIPLNAAGLGVKAQGVFKSKILPKEHVDHLINDDGANSTIATRRNSD